MTTPDRRELCGAQERSKFSPPTRHTHKQGLRLTSPLVVLLTPTSISPESLLGPEPPEGLPFLGLSPPPPPFPPIPTILLTAGEGLLCPFDGPPPPPPPPAPYFPFSLVLALLLSVFCHGAPSAGKSVSESSLTDLRLGPAEFDETRREFEAADRVERFELDPTRLVW